MSLPLESISRIASPPRGALPETDIPCVRAEERVQREVPVVPLDVRLSADGFAPIYFWGMDAQLGEVRLSRGTIVTGRARSANGDAPIDLIDVELRPSSMSWAPEDQERVRRQKHAAKTNPRGFFQFENVAPGEYAVVATKKGSSPAEYRVHVTPVAFEAVVERELVLGELARIEVSIQPPVDAEQRPWTVALSRVVTGNSEPVARSGEDVEAALQFMQQSGKRIDLQSDAEGRFAGTLPSQGKWDVEVRHGAARITIRDVAVQRGESGYAELVLELPDGRVRGKVVDAAGQPHVANVTLFRDKRREAYARTGDDGEFEFTGVGEGEVELTADARAGNSGTVPHTIKGAADERLRIVIAPRNVVRARVLSPEGRPVAGALVVWVTEYAIRDAITSPTGDVTIKLPPGLAGITIFVSAPGFPLKLAHLSVRDDTAAVRLPAFAGTLLVRYDTRRWPSLMFGSGNDQMYLGATNGMGSRSEGMPVRFTREGCMLSVEPGTYTVCQTRANRCETRDVRAGARETIDAMEWSE